MPSSILNKLDIGDLTPTSISLMMTDRSVAFPRGILEGALVKVDNFIFPMDFVVLDMEEDREVPIILGRPFLAIGQALIAVCEGNLTLRVSVEEVKFNILQAMKFPSEVPSCKRIEVLQACTEIHLQELIRADPLEKCLGGSLSKVDLDKETLACADGVMETILALDNKEKGEVIKEEIKTTNGLVIKKLPAHLRYSFLGDNDTKTVIISADTTKEEEQQLLEVLHQYQSTFAWSISDIKGISPLVCMHKVLMEDDYKPTVEHQRRLNLAMKEVVKKEVLK